MAENLNFKEEQIGPTRGSKCYDDKESNCDKYGRLYEWDDALEVCPVGWHLPTRAEWNTLLSYVGDQYIAGKKLKAKASDWGNGYGRDNYGFAALPGGWDTGEFAEINTAGYWWNATEVSNYYDDGGFKRMLGTENTVWEDNISGRPKTNQLSVRCVLGSSSSSSITYGELEDERDSKKYRTVRIGTQNWMAENLNFETEDGSTCYDGKDSNCDTYGRLYNWEVARTTACPSGWKLPTSSEWNALIDYVGANAGKKLKAKASNWGNGYGRDNYGFAALPGGWNTGEFAEINTTGWWWTATEANRVYNDRGGFKRILGTGNGVWEDDISGRPKTNQLSVRCIEI
jgi:uncharacterized protein (TIGR02145 family)